MIIALAGYHRTGKSSLMEALAKVDLACSYQVNTSEFFKQLMINPKDERSPVEILSLQYALYNFYSRVLQNVAYYASSITKVLDRSPVDYAAYTLMQLQGTKYELEATELANKFMLLNSYVDKVVLLNPGIPVENADKSFDYDESDAIAYTALMRSLALTLNSKYEEIPADITNLYSRIGFMQTTLNLTPKGIHKQMNPTADMLSMLSTKPYISNTPIVDLCSEITLPSGIIATKKLSN